MKKCTDCDPSNKISPTINDQDLWLEMMNSMVHFTETSQALVRSMQGKLGVTPTAGGANKPNCDPCGLLEQLKGQLAGMTVGAKRPTVCKCTSPSEKMDKSCSSEDAKAGIQCYQSPKLIKKKKYKYSAEIESKLSSLKKKDSSPCVCEGKDGKKQVDTCLCENLPSEIEKRADCSEDLCPIAVCSALEQDEIENITCIGKTVAVQSEEPTPKETPVSMQQVQKADKDDPLAWILKPGTYNPDDLPQDDTHPFILKEPDTFKLPDNVLGYELFEAMEKFEDNIAQIDDETGEQESYGEFRRKCILVAARLKEKVGKDDIVGLCTSNHKDRSIPYLATLFIGNRVVAFDRQLTTSETSECLKNVTPKIMFVSSNALSHIEESMKAAQVDFEIVVFGDEGTYDSFETYLEEDDSKVENFKPNKAGSFDSTALICFTSGFPDRPKAACLSHYGLLRQSLQLVEFQNILPVILNYCEISQIRTILVLFSSIFAGATRIIVEDFELARLWKLIEKYKIKSIYLNPHQCAEISTLPEPEEDVSSLFCIFTVGERIGKNIVNRLKDTLMGSLICQIYGHTELSGLTALYKFKRPEDHVLSHFKPTSCGKPVDGILYKVIDINTGKILNHLATGELYVKSRMVLNGLLVNNKEQPLNKQEWMKTHDLVYYDAYRCFHFAGKINSLIKCNNKVIFPSKLEDILMNHPKVDTAVVLGIPHDGDGEQAIGLVKLNDKKGVSAKDLENLVNSSVSKDEQLKQGIKIVENVPYTSTGKINRAILLDKVLNGKI